MPTIKRIRNEPHSVVGDLIETSVPNVIARWLERVKEDQPKATRVHHGILVDHLPVFLAKLGHALATAGDSENVKREASEHGDQRWDNGWSITEVVRDYQILRFVLIEFLECELDRRLGVRESLVLNVMIDDAIAAAVTSFAASQASPGTVASATRSEALELLLNVLGVVGHEMRNPLSPLATSLEILRLVTDDPKKIEETRQMMARQVQILNRLVEDLMDLPRLARGKMSIVRERIDLASLVKACAEDRRGFLEEAGISLTTDVPSVPAWTHGDRTRLTQAFGNLLGNAQKFTDRGGKVEVALTIQESKWALISIRDTGLGIDKNFLPKIFEAYTQADQLSSNRGGLGLGLALVRGVVELHGGSVVVASEGLGKGATFTVKLPLFESAGEPLTDGVSESLPPVKSRRVLIIEDNADSAMSLKMYLELHGHTVAIANSGLVGIQEATRFRPEVVVCDIGLPDTDGYAVAAELRKIMAPPAELIIAISGHGSRKGPDGEPDPLFDFYLLKPADPARLASLLAADSRPK